MRVLPYFAPLTIAFAFAITGCADTSRFSTSADESYCGDIVGAPFVRAKDVSATAKMRLVLDADNLQNAPGQLWTTELTPGEKLSASAILIIPELASDSLSQFSFGEGHVKDVLALASLGTTDVNVVLSLLKSGDVEVRLIRGTSEGSRRPAAPGAPAQIYAVFHLHREKGDCGLK